MNNLLVALLLMAVFPSWGLIHRIYDVFLIFIIVEGTIFVAERGSNLRIRFIENWISYIFIALKFMSIMSIFIAFDA